jgi:hypothetical protein
MYLPVFMHQTVGFLLSESREDKRILISGEYLHGSTACQVIFSFMACTLVLSVLSRPIHQGSSTCQLVKRVMHAIQVHVDFQHGKERLEGER